MSMLPDSSLTSMVRRGELNFELLAEVLFRPGYLIEASSDDGLNLGSVVIERARQEDFEALWRFFYPNEGHSITLRSCASDKGFAVRGGYTYALFNEQLVSREEMMEKLERLNAKMEQKFPSMG
jgi:hypothetical protein